MPLVSLLRLIRSSGFSVKLARYKACPRNTLDQASPPSSVRHCVPRAQTTSHACSHAGKALQPDGRAGARQLHQKGADGARPQRTSRADCCGRGGAFCVFEGPPEGITMAVEETVYIYIYIYLYI